MKYKANELKKTKDIVEVEVSVPYTELAPIEEAVYKELSKDIRIEGFRPGKAPRSKIEAKLGSKVLTESLGRLLPLVTWEVIKEKGYRPTSSPEYSLKKVSDGDGIDFVFSFVAYPDVKLGDFSKIKTKKTDIEVTEEDVDNVIRSIARSSLKPERIDELSIHKSSNPKKVEKDMKISKTKQSKEIKSSDKFELNDELVSELNYEGIKTLKELRRMVKAKLTDMKSQQSENEYNSSVLIEAVKLSKFEIPESFVEREIANSEAQFSSRLKEIKLDVETYLKTQGSSLEKKREDWKKEAIDKIGVDLVLVELANEHKIVAHDADIDKEIDSIEDESIKSQYKSDNAREYIRTVITRQRGMQKLLEIVGDQKRN